MAGSPPPSPTYSNASDDKAPLLGEARKGNGPGRQKRIDEMRPAGVTPKQWHFWTKIAKYISDTTGSEKFWDVIGSISTVLAMIPQGYFGMLLMDFLLLQKLALHYRIPLDVTFFLGSEEGKRQLIRFFNEANYKGLAHKEWKKDINPKNWTAAGMALGLETIIASLTFGGLTIIANDAAAGLVESYDLTSPAAIAFVDILARVFRNRWYDLPFVFASTSANFLVFPYMVSSALRTTRDILLLPLESPAHWAAQEAWYDEVEAIRLCLKDLFNHGYINEYNTILTRLIKNPPAEDAPLPTSFPPPFIDSDCGFNREEVHHFFEYMKRTLALTNLAKREQLANQNTTLEEKMRLLEQAITPARIEEEYSKIRHYKPTQLYKTLRSLTKIAVIGTVAAGLWNFRSISVAGIKAMIKMYLPFIPFDQIPSEYMGVLRSIFDKVVGFGSFGAMTSMSITIMNPTTEEVFDSLFGGGRGRNTNVLSPGWYLTLAIFAGLFAALSGGPNAYQALKEGEDPTMMALAYWSSIALEAMGLWAYSKSLRVRRLPDDLRRIDAADAALMGLAKTYMPGPEAPPRFRESLQQYSLFRDQQTVHQGRDEEAGTVVARRPHRTTCSCVVL